MAELIADSTASFRYQGKPKLPILRGRLAPCSRTAKAKAQIAVTRSILVIIWHPLADPAARFTDLGPGYHHARTDTDHRLSNNIRQIQALASPSPSSRPNNPYGPLTRPDHRTRPGSVAARPLSLSNFPVKCAAIAAKLSAMLCSTWSKQACTETAPGWS